MTDEQAAPPSGVEVTLSRELGLSEVLMIGIGPNIGSSIFLLIGFARDLGPALLAVFILNFIVTIFTAMAYAELASAYPETGGVTLSSRKGFPDRGWDPGRMDVMDRSLYSL